MRIFAGTTVVSHTSLILASCLLLPVHNTAANEDVEVLVSQSDKNLAVEFSPKGLETLAGEEGPGNKSDTPTTEVQPVDPVNEVYVSGVEWRKSITEVGQDLIDVDLKVGSRNDQEKETTFKDILTSQVIEYIADYYDINIVLDTSVDELITIHLVGANWFEDLARVAKVSGLNMCSRASGTVVFTQETTGNCPMAHVGEVLSLNFSEIEVASVLVLLSDFTGNSISTCYPMEAKVNLRLKNVKWDQAFDEILLVSDLRVGRVGDSLLVRTADAQQCNIKK